MKIVTAFLVLFLLSGCATSPENHYYILESSPIGTAGSVKVASVILPDYLDRPQVVARHGTDLQIKEFDRWGSPLDDMILNGLNEDLAPSPMSRKVKVTIEDFALDINKGVVLQAHWNDITVDNKPVGKIHNFNQTMSGVEDTPDAIAEAMSQLLMQLAMSVRKGSG